MANWRGGHILNILITFADICARNWENRQFRGGGFLPHATCMQHCTHVTQINKPNSIG